MSIPLMGLGSMALGAALVASCGAPLSLAVENRDDAAYLLRVIDGRHRAWRVPPDASGIGPIDDGTETRFVVVSSLDCTEVGRFGMGTGAHTLVIEGGGMANPDSRDSIDPSLTLLEQIVDPCG